jgi:Family of unknown function (DUF6069)
MSNTATLPPRTSVPYRDGAPTYSDSATTPLRASSASADAASRQYRPVPVYAEPPQYQGATNAYPSARRGIDQMRYWVGIGITAVVAALATVIGLVAAHIAKVSVVPGASGMLTPAHAATFGLTAAAITLVAGALYAAMLRVAPRPALYYGWLVGLLTVLAVLVPFTMGAALATAIALACINLVVGLVVMSLVPVAADNARVDG